MAISNRTMSVPLLAVAFALLLPGGDAIRMMAGAKAGRRGGGAAKGKKVAPAAKLGGKGFGSALAAKKGAGGGVLLTEPRYEALYEWLRTSPETNLKKVGVGEFDGLRGVMALQDIAAGEEIVGIPAAFAVNLGTESADPLPAAQRLLATRAAEVEPAYELDEDELDNPDADAAVLPSSPRAAYWETLPPPDSPDLCTPDFFSEKELQMMQWPPLVVETRSRSGAIRNALGAAAPTGDTSVASLSAAGGRLRELRWAVWAVLSRVLTVQGPPAATGGLSASSGPAAYKLLIPFIDMFNHKAGTKHYLTGRTDGRLRVVAGSPIKAGEQIFILYGTAATSNQEFVAHYGFHDPSQAAAAADRALVRQRRDFVPALRHTTIEADEELLAELLRDGAPYTETLALRLRLSLKRAAQQEGLLDEAE